MTLIAEGRGHVVLHQKFTELVVVRIVAGGALHLTVVIGAGAAGEGRRIMQFPAVGGQFGVVSEGNGVVVRQVLIEVTAGFEPSLLRAVVACLGGCS